MKPNDLSIVVRCQANVRLLDGTLNGWDGSLVIGLNNQECRFRGADTCDLFQRCGSAIVINIDAIKHSGIGTASSDGGEVTLHALQALLHAVHLQDKNKYISGSLE